MSNKKLAILGVVAAVVLACAIFQTKLANRPPADLKEVSYLIQGLATDKIGSIEVKGKNDQVILSRGGNGFVVASKDNYPANADMISDLITVCLDIRSAELTTDDPANHVDLGVTEEGAEFVVRFFDRESNLITGIVISEADPEKRTRYARLITDEDVHLILNVPQLDASPIHYINKELFVINRDKIESVTVKSPSETYTLKKDGDSVTLDNIPDGKKLRDEKIHDQVFNALAGMTFDDVINQSSASADLKFDKTFTCKLSDSTVYTLQVAVKDEKTFIKCTAEFADKSEITKTQGVVESQEVLKEKETKLLARDSAENFAEDHAGWIYQASRNKAQYLTKIVVDLVTDIEKEEPEAATEQVMPKL